MQPSSKPTELRANHATPSPNGGLSHTRKVPGAHSHPEDDIFYVIEGTMSVLVGETWTHATRGSFILIPGGVTHDFENRGDVRAGVLNLSIPGSFESHMPEIARWFSENPPKDAGI